MSLSSHNLDDTSTKCINILKLVSNKEGQKNHLEFTGQLAIGSDGVQISRNEIAKQASHSEAVMAEVPDAVEPLERKALTMKEHLFQKNKDKSLKLVNISHGAKRLSLKEMLAERESGKKRRALVDAKSMVQEQESITDHEEATAECETCEETSGVPETSVPEVNSMSNDSDVRTDGLHTSEDVTEQASHSEEDMPEIPDEVESAEETLPSMKEILLQKSKEKALKLVNVAPMKELTNIQKMIVETRKRRALAEARAKAEEQESIDEDEDGSAEVTTYEDTPADHETTSSPEMDSIPQYPMTSLTAGRYQDQDQDQDQDQ